MLIRFCATPGSVLAHRIYGGTGYPRGLRGEQIPLGARIFSTPTAWTPLIGDRPYQALPMSHARDEIYGTQFDPKSRSISIYPGGTLGELPRQRARLSGYLAT
jgi:hypothetical protein